MEFEPNDGGAKELESFKCIYNQLVRLVKCYFAPNYLQR